jgi:hypothetical protein
MQHYPGGLIKRMDKSKSFKWFRIVGHPADEKVNPGFTFVYYVEALKPQHVVKYYGGKRKYDDAKNGLQLLVQFSGRFQDVLPMPATWNPWEQSRELQEGQGTIKTITKIIPATRYQCDCGEVRLSEFPYPSMWCSCGHKAFPLEDTFMG